jgi:hypothetical protein
VTNYQLTREQLLEYPGLNGMRAACHLRVYEASRRKPVCIVGNFDDGVGTTTTNAIEMVATAIREPIGLRRFRLIEWYAHGYPRWPFSEVRLRRAWRAEREAGRIMIMGDEGGLDVDRVRRIPVRFMNPRWQGMNEQGVAELLGADALKELTDLAGEYDGDYDAERALGERARDRVSELERHNTQRVQEIVAQLSEWGVR